MTIVQIFAIVSTLKYELGIPLVNNHQERLSLFRISIINTFLIAISIFIILNIYTLLVADNFSKDINSLKYFIPIGIILVSLFHHILYNWLLYKKKFNYISIAKIIFGFVYAILPILVFKISGLKDYSYLVISHQLGLIIGLISIFFLLYRKSILNDLISLFVFKIKDLTQIMRKYKKYALFSSPATFMNTVSIWIPVIFIWIFFEEKYTSLFFLAHRVVNLPILLLGHSIGKIFYSEASLNLNRGTLDKSIIKYFKILVHIAVPFLFLSLFLSQDLFNAIYSADWSEAGNITQILSPWLFFTFLAAPISTVPTILYKQEVEFKFQLVLLIIRISTLMLGTIVFSDLFITLILFSIGSALAWMVYLFFILKMSGIKIKVLFLKCMDNKYEFLMTLFIVISIYKFIDNPVYTLICTIPLLLYLFYSLILEIKKIEI